MGKASRKSVSVRPDDAHASASLPLRRASIGARRNPASAEAILDAAEAILNEQGASGFSVEAVARRAGAGKPTIYRWWPNKTALLLDVYLRQKLELPSDDLGSLPADLQAMISGLFRFWSETAGGRVFRSVIAEAQTDPDALIALQAFVSQRVELVVVIFERARARGELAADADSNILAELVVGFLWVRLLTGLNADGDDIARFVQHIVRGAAAAPTLPADGGRPGQKARTL